MHELDSIGVDVLKSYMVLYFGHTSKPNILIHVQNMAPYNVSLPLHNKIYSWLFVKPHIDFVVLLPMREWVMTVSNLECRSWCWGAYIC